MIEFKIVQEGDRIGISVFKNKEKLGYSIVPFFGRFGKLYAYLGSRVYICTFLLLFNNFSLFNALDSYTKYDKI